MERRTLLANILGGLGGIFVVGASRLFGQKSNGNTGKTAAVSAPCKLPVGGPRAGYFPNVVLLNQDEVRGRFYDDLVMGRTVIFSSFALGNPSQMQKDVMANLVGLQKALGNRLGRDVFMYSITFDPEHDTPQALHSYAKRMGIGSSWSLLTGRPEDVYFVLSRVGLGYVRTEHHTMAPHFGLLRLGNEALDRWTTMPAVFAPRMIIERLSVLEVRPERKDPKLFVRGGPFPKELPAAARRGATETKS